MIKEIEIRKLTTLTELKQIQTLEKTIWKMDPLPIHQTFTAVKNGGIILGAYLDDELIGFSYGFPGFQKGRVYFCSHMLGIDPHYQKHGIGKLLKEKQKELCLELGYPLITWTYDPLLSVNAYLNLHHLHGIATKYTKNLYGEMDDLLNHGLPSDRFTIEWWIGSKDETEMNQIREKVMMSKINILTDQSIPEKIQHYDHWFVKIPSDFQKLKVNDRESALNWRLKTRAIFQQLLDEGYVGVDLRRKKHFSYYHFMKNDRLPAFGKEQL